MGKETDPDKKPADDRARDAGPDRHAPDRDDDLDKDPRADERSRALAGQEAAKSAAPQTPRSAQGPAAPQAAPIHGLVRSPTAPGGTVIADAQIDIAFVPPEFLPDEPPATVGAALLVDGDRLIVDVAIGLEHWTTSMSASEAAEALVGRDAMKELGSAIDFVHRLAKKRVSGRMFRIGLWGNAPNDSFVVLDLARVVRSIGKGTLTGFRPVEAQILLNDTKGNNLGGVRLFGGEAVPAATAIPGKPIGDWFVLPDVPELHAALGQDTDDKQAKHELWGGAFYADGVLRVAVKPSKDAKTGLVAHINLAEIANKLAALGEKVAEWVKKLLAKIEAGAINLFRSIKAGLLRLELPDMKGIWFDFDFNLTLPKLFKGGGGGFNFDLSGLWPSGFNLDFNFGISLGAMPKLSLPWLRAPRLGGFDVPWPNLKGLLPTLPDLKVPDFNFKFGFHRIGGLKFGLGTDLSLAWPELGDLALGFTIDLEKILDAIAGAGKWLLRKLRAAGDFINRWIHLGSDGVLRIYDRDRPDGPMLGFHLLRLLDGAQAEDLAPTEIRWTEKEAGIGVELGEKREADEEKSGDKGKGSPQKPGGIVLAKKQGMDPPDSLVKVMALAAGAKVDAELHAEGDHVVVWAEAASAVYDKGQALRTSLNVRTLATRAIEKWPAGQGKPPGASHFEIEKNPAESHGGARLNFTLPTAVGVQAGKGYAIWKMEHLLRAKDWTDLAPDEWKLPLGKLGGIQVGTLDTSLVGPVLGKRFGFESRPLAQKLLHDTDNTVYGGVHKKGDNVGVSVTKEENGDEGALAHINLTELLTQLKRLGDVGRRALEYIADLKVPGWRGSGGAKSDVFAKIAEIAKAIGSALSDLVNGILKLDLGGGRFIQWNLKAQLPRLGIDLDLTELIPEFELNLPGMPDFSFAFLPSGSFGNPLEGLSFKLPDVGLRDLLGKLPNVKLPKDLHVNLSWIGDLLGVSVELGDLFGTGNLSFGFKLPIAKMLEKLGKMFGKIGGKAKDLARHLHLGSDGVLRIFDPTDPKGPRVGFDLKKLFDGVDPEDLVPVEAHAEIEVGDGKDRKTLAEVSFGDAYVSDQDKKDAKLPDADNKGGGKHAGAVLVPRPKGTPIENASFTAPEWLSAHLGAAKNARVHGSLYVTGDKAQPIATLFAVVDGSDRGVEVSINIAALTQRANLPANDGKGITFDKHASTARGMFVLAVKTDKVAGHAGWKLSSLLNTPSLESLLPDELVLEREEGKLTVGSEIDVSKLRSQGTFTFPSWGYVTSRLGGKPVEVYTNDFKKGDPKVALVDATDKDDKRAGVELELDHKFVVSLNSKLKKLAKQVKGTVGSVMGRSPDAQKQSLPTDLSVYPTASGIMVERGHTGDEFHMYAKWSWQDLGSLMEGEVTAENLMPDDFRVATRGLAAEVKDLGSETGKQLPGSAKLVGKMHPLLKDTLKTFGIADSQWVDLALHHPETKVVDEEKQLIRVHGAIYDADAALKITGGKSLDLDLSLQALIAQVMPQRQRAWSKKKKDDDGADGKKKGFHLTGGIDVHRDAHGQADGIDMHAGVERVNRKGEQTEFEVRVGWTFDQILNMLMNLDQMITADGKPNLKAAAGLLTPKRIGGRFETDDFRVDFGNDGHASSMNTSVDDIPGLGPLLGMIVDPATVAQAKLHLSLPSKEQFTKSFDDATAKIKNGEVDYKLPIGDCAIELPVKNTDDPAGAMGSKFYQITLSVSPLKFKALLQLIPGIGQYIKIADLVVGVLKDPKGALEGAMYTPEALYMVFSNSGEIWGAVKEKGWKGVAMAMFVNGDMSTKQGVMAGRIYKKMKAAGWTKKGDKIPDIAGMDPDYLKWLAEQDGDKLVAMQRMSEEMDKMGLGGALDQEKPQIPAGGLPDVETINTRISEIEAGYTEFAKVQETAGDDQAKVDAAANNLRKRIEKAIAAGAKPSGGVDVSGKATSKDKPTNTEDREYSDITDLPPPDADHSKIAQDIFDADKQKGGDEKDKVVVTMEDAQYLINKYSGLSTEQLGDMLASGHTKVTTKDGREREMPMHEEERAFVRTLFLRRLAAEGVDLEKAQGGGSTSDADLVTAYRSQKARAEREAARSAGKGANDASGDKQDGGSGGSTEVSYEDGDGTGGTLDDVFGEGAEKGEGEGEGKEAGAGGESETGVEEKSEGDKESGEVGDDTGGVEQEDEQKEFGSLKEAFRIGFGNAREWVSFDPAKGTAALKKDATKDYIGVTRMYQGLEWHLDDIALAAYTARGDGAKQVFELTIQLTVSTDKLQGIPTELNFTFLYTPSEDKMSAYGGMNDPLLFMQKMNGAVDVTGETSAQLSATPQFTIEGWDMTVIDIVSVRARNISQAWVTMRVQFNKIPQSSVTVKGPDGPQLVRAGDSAIMELPLDRDKKSR